jgi:superoxide dismutase, Cu-Zn family
VAGALMAYHNGMRILSFTLPLFLAACGGGTKQTAQTVETAAKEKAPAGGALEPRSGSTTTGFVEAAPMADGTHLTIRVSNATPGKHGAHLHETGDCSSPDAKSAGAHWNPDSAQHGARAPGTAAISATSRSAPTAPGR